MLRLLAVCLLFAVGCSSPSEPPASSGPPVAPADSEHAGITEPHGDHSAQHGGMVLMNEDLHYEVVFDRSGQHRIWFTDAVRYDLPASIASGVTMILTRPGAPEERLALEIDESGESWIASGKPVEGDDVMVKISYSVQGVPHEIEVPFFIPAAS